VTQQIAGPAGAAADDEVEASRAPLMDHLVELRTRLVRIIRALAVLFIGAWFITQPALEFLLTPLGEAAVRHGREMNEFEAITTAPMEMVIVQMKLAFLIALAVGFPYFAYQIYGFIAPGLYKHEKRAVTPFLIVMPLLFIAGAAIVYFYVLPSFMDISFGQEFSGTKARVVYLPKVKEYYELAISLLTCFGLAFQLPVVIALLAQAGVVEAATLRKTRKYAFVVILFVAAIMTPPDPFSLFFLAAPLFLLFESGILAAALIERAQKKKDAAEAAAAA
jgi:sec-independent protein translocase protein TatC